MSQAGWARPFAFSRPAWLVAAVVMSLAGCDYNAGVLRGATLDSMPDLACVQKAIARVPGVTNVKHTHSKIYDAEDFAYDAEGVAVLVTFEHREGELWYRNRYMLLNQKPPVELVKRLRLVMERVDSELEADCRLNAKVRDLILTCPDAECSPDSPRNN